MKTLKAICTAAILALALSIPAYAGDILVPGYTAPPPPPESNITVDMSVPTPTSSALDDMSKRDMSTPGFADLLWVLASMF